VRGSEGLRMGVLLVPRGAVDLVLAVTLLANGVLSTSGYALAVTMIAVTTVGGALLARLAFQGAPAAPEREPERLSLRLGRDGWPGAALAHVVSPGVGACAAPPEPETDTGLGGRSPWIGPGAGEPVPGRR